MNNYKFLFTYCVVLFIRLIIFIIQIKFLFLFIIDVINRLFFHFVTILVANHIGDEGATALAEALKLNKNLTELYLRKLLLFFKNYYYYLIRSATFGCFTFF